MGRYGINTERVLRVPMPLLRSRQKSSGKAIHLLLNSGHQKFTKTGFLSALLEEPALVSEDHLKFG
jgi:hypothetical protein